MAPYDFRTLLFVCVCARRRDPTTLKRSEVTVLSWKLLCAFSGLPHSQGPLRIPHSTGRPCAGLSRVFKRKTGAMTVLENLRRVFCREAAVLPAGGQCRTRPGVFSPFPFGIGHYLFEIAQDLSIDQQSPKDGVPTNLPFASTLSSSSLFPFSRPRPSTF